jgi:microcystin-dependent protein
LRTLKRIYFNLVKIKIIPVMSDPFIAEIRMFGGNFAPSGWAFCEGQLLLINSNTALFALVGTAYGGDGQTTLGLPDLRGRVPIHSGGGSAGAGLPPYGLGQKGGTETNTIEVNQMPAHTHSINITSAGADETNPIGNLLATTDEDVYGETPNPGSFYGEGTRNSGSNQTVPNMMPSAVVSYIIALVGTFPSRN